MRAIAFVVAAYFAVANATNEITPTTAPAPNAVIPYTDTKAFPLPTWVTTDEMLAGMFNPELLVGGSACHPYPAVNIEGQTSSGLPHAGADCRNSDLGQVYARSDYAGRDLVYVVFPDCQRRRMDALYRVDYPPRHGYRSCGNFDTGHTRGIRNREA